MRCFTASFRVIQPLCEATIILKIPKPVPPEVTIFGVAVRSAAIPEIGCANSQKYLNVDF